MNVQLARLARSFLLPVFSIGAIAACAQAESSPGGDRFEKPWGYWEGKGSYVITDIKDKFRLMQRKADCEFWFTMDGSGVVSGEVEIRYDATLTVTGLPEFTGPVTFAPEVGGKVTDPNPKRRYPMFGRYDGGALALKAAILDDAAPVMFTFRASAGVGASGGGIGGEMLRTGDISQEMPMTPFDPFVATGAVQKRPHGPHAARFEMNDPNLSVQWTATQITSREERR